MEHYLGALIGKYDIHCEPLLDPVLDVPGMMPANITLVNYRNRLIWAVRLASYLYLPFTQDPNVSKIRFLQSPSQSKIAIGEWHWNSKLLDLPAGNTALWGMFSGPEDPRLYTVYDPNETLYMIVARPDMEPNKVEQVVYRLDDSLQPETSFRVPSPNAMEKNWAPVQGGWHEFLYDPSQGTTVKLTTNSIHPDTANLVGPTQFSNQDGGSSQVIPLDEYRWMTITHNRWWHSMGGYVRFSYNHNLRIMHREGPNFVTDKCLDFRFLIPGIEFCCGLTEFQGRIYIGFSIWDGSVHVLSFPKSNLDVILDALAGDTGCEVSNYFTNSFQYRITGVWNHPSMIQWIGHGLSQEQELEIIEDCQGYLPSNILDSLRLQVIMRHRA